MRPGLVVAGIGFLLVAAVVLLALITLPSGTNTQSTRFVSAQIPQGSEARAFVWGLNGTSVVLALSWHTSLPVNATLSEPSDCSGTGPASCISGTVLVRWTGNSSGAWATAGHPSFPLLLVFQHDGAGVASMSASILSSQASITPISTWAYVSFLASGIALATLGGFSLFLGLFLRAGVFRDRATVRGPGGPGPGADPPRY